MIGRAVLVGGPERQHLPHAQARLHEEIDKAVGVRPKITGGQRRRMQQHAGAAAV